MSLNSRKEWEKARNRERVRDERALTATGCMDSVTGASIVCIWWRPPAVLWMFSPCCPGVCEGSEPNGHCGHCPEMANYSFALRLDRWPARSPAWPIISLCVCVQAFFINMLQHFTSYSPGVNTIEIYLLLLFKMWCFYYKICKTCVVKLRRK